MTLEAMIAEITDNLALGGVGAPQGNERILRCINRAKDEVVAALEKMDQELFTTRTTLTITAGSSATATLPSDFRRAISLVRTDVTPIVDVVIIDGREAASYENGYNPPSRSILDTIICYPEGGTLYFIGTVPAMTLRLRYRKQVTDLAISNLSSSFSDIPSDWHPLVTDLATTYMLPAANPEYAKVMGRYNSTLALALVANTRRMNTGQHVITMAGD